MMENERDFLGTAREQFRWWDDVDVDGAEDAYQRGKAKSAQREYREATMMSAAIAQAEATTRLADAAEERNRWLAHIAGAVDTAMAQTVAARKMAQEETSEEVRLSGYMFEYITNLLDGDAVSVQFEKSVSKSDIYICRIGYSEAVKIGSDGNVAGALDQALVDNG